MSSNIKFNRIRLDENIGFLVGIGFASVIAKLWIVPDLSIWEIVKVMVRAHMWW